MFRPNNLYSVLTPMYYTTKIFGLTPFSITNKGFIKSTTNLVYSIFFVLALQTYTIITYNNIPDFDDGIMENVISILDTYTSQAGIFCEIFFECIFIEDILGALEEINAFDKNIQLGFQIDLNKEYRRSKFFVILALLGTLLFTSISVSVTAIGTYDETTVDFFGEFIFFSAPAVINTFVDLQICVLFLCLKRRFGWLNKKITAISKSLQNNLEGSKNIFTTITKNKFSIPTITTSFKRENLVCRIEKIRRRHFLLCKISKTLNKAYSVQILLIVLQNFVTLTTAAYYGGKHMIVDKIIPIDYVSYTIIQLSLAFSQTLALIYVCSNTTAEARKMGILLHGISLLNGEVETKYKEELQIEITIFSLQLLHHNVEFTACKAFVINESLLFSMIGALATYLVIVIQFDTNASLHV